MVFDWLGFGAVSKCPVSLHFLPWQNSYEYFVAGLRPLIFFWTVKSLPEVDLILAVRVLPPPLTVALTLPGLVVCPQTIAEPLVISPAVTPSVNGFAAPAAAGAAKATAIAPIPAKSGVLPTCPVYAQKGGHWKGARKRGPI